MIAPTSLRTRIGMASLNLRQRPHDYMVRHRRRQPSDRMTSLAFAFRDPPPPRSGCGLLVGRRDDVRDALRWAVCNAAHRKSGLSIVEWKPVTGVVPPLGRETRGQVEFDKYKGHPAIPRAPSGGCASMSSRRSIGGEWDAPVCWHVSWGGVFLVPFVWFLWRGWVEPPATRAGYGRFFALGAALGAIGWWMVRLGPL